MNIDNLIINADLIEILEELKYQLHSSGIDLLDDIKDSGNDIMVTCPYHKNGHERKPSAGIRKEDGVFHCFTCSETHSLPELISNCFGKDDGGVFGINWLISNFLSVSIENRKPIDLDVKHQEDTTYVSEEELDSYRYYHPYWAKRKITDNTIIDLFDLGFDIKTNCITFPVRDLKGGCLFVARRSVETKYFNYPSGVKKPIYGAYELTLLRDCPKEVIICESMLDALVFWQIGKYAVALNGLGSSEQLDELNRMPCRKFILCTDNDEAGMYARKLLRNKIKYHLITEYLLPDGKKDANDCTVDELKNLVEIF